MSHPTVPGIFLVPLTRGRFAVVDIDDADEVGKVSWQYKPKSGRKTGYAQRIWRDADGLKHGLTLHRLIARRMGISDDVKIDHGDRNGLNCRRLNLREANGSQNQANRSMQSNNTSGAKGVSWDASRDKWRASVKSGATYAGRRFDDYDDAVEWAACQRRQLHGDFARDR